MLDETVPSTHGIEISAAPLARAPGESPLATLRIWDFGGQDIYHGTHALLPPGLMRALISQIGSEAGLAAEYWRDGFYFYDQQRTARRCRAALD